MYSVKVNEHATQPDYWEILQMTEYLNIFFSFQRRTFEDYRFWFRQANQRSDLDTLWNAWIFGSRNNSVKGGDEKNVDFTFWEKKREWGLILIEGDF